ncbi:MAG TPA: TfoX/Sxy family protein [Candidatus Dormibacteraeota bacterium]
MTYDRDLAQRIRIALASVPDVDTRLMFGGIAFMVGGHMACGVIGQDLMLRLGSEATQRALQEPHVRVMDFTGRPSRGMVYVGAEGTGDPSNLQRWIDAATAFVATLPPRRSS